MAFPSMWVTLAGSATTSGPLGPCEGGPGFEDQSTYVTLQDTGPVFPLPSSQTDVGLSDDSSTAFSQLVVTAAGSCRKLRPRR